MIGGFPLQRSTLVGTIIYGPTHVTVGHHHWLVTGTCFLWWLIIAGSSWAADHQGVGEWELIDLKEPGFSFRTCKAFLEIFPGHFWDMSSSDDRKQQALQALLLLMTGAPAQGSMPNDCRSDDR